MNTMNTAIEKVIALGKAIRELGEVPDGVLYAQVMGIMNLDEYNGIIRVLVGQKLVQKENDVLRWVAG